MFCKIITAAVLGVRALFVTVEADMDKGLPSFSMVGSPSAEVRESRERVAVALKNIGFQLPAARITVNLAPADVKKDGTGFDLPIAVAILQSMAYISQEQTQKVLFVGELGLNGEIKKVPGILPIVRAAAKAGIRECIVPAENAKEGGVVQEVTVRGAKTLQQVLSFLRRESDWEKLLPAVSLDWTQTMLQTGQEQEEDFSQVSGQKMAKRAGEIAAAGFHNLLMMGPPGSGKTMIARRLAGILPALTLEESMEITEIYSVAGQLTEESPVILKRPFLNPHHTISKAAMIGGGSRPHPGIASLSHRGILFMDEFPEFSPHVIDSLRQPLEDHAVQINRIGGNVSYPADFLLVCAMNPCPCGYYPDLNRCRCSENKRIAYRSRISGPIMDRIDLWVELQKTDIKSLQSPAGEENSARIRERVAGARSIQELRFSGKNYRFNAEIPAGDMEEYCFLGKREKKLMEQLYTSLGLGARSYHRVIKVARTIADLEGAEKIQENHLLEAALYRPGEMGKT